MREPECARFTRATVAAVHGTGSRAKTRGSACPRALHLLIWRRVFANERERHIQKSRTGCRFPHDLQQAPRAAGLLGVNLAGLTGAVLAEPIEHRTQGRAAVGRNEVLDGSPGQAAAA